MTSARPPVPPVNLKDRIAALEKRKASPDQHTTHVTPNLSTNSRVGTLRDKIASFEKQGAVPVPRGSFGIGAPPVDDGSSKRKGELYGNRVPGLSKPAIESIAAARKRSASSHTPSPSMSFSRPVTPSMFDSYDENPLPPLLNADDGEPRLPSTISFTERRAVSDVLPQTQISPELEDTPIPETEEKTVAKDANNHMEPLELSESDDVVVASDAPAIVVSPEPKTPQVFELEGIDHSASPSPTTAGVSEPHEEAQESSPTSPVAENIEEFGNRTPISASTISSMHSPSPRSPNVPLHVEIDPRSPVEELFPAPGETPSDDATPPRDLPSAVSSAEPSPLQTAATSDLPLTNQEDVVSPVNSIQSVSVPDVTSPSTSPLPTPADSVFSQVSVTSEVSSLAADLPSPSLAPPVSAVLGSHVLEPVTPQTAYSEVSEASYYPPTPDVAEVADESLTLDTSDAIIVKDPLKISPTVTQGRLIPAPRPTNPTPPITPLSANTIVSPTTTGSSSGSPVKRFNSTNKSLPPLVSPTPSEDLFSINKYDGQLSFHAVVHEKVRQPGGSTLSTPIEGPPRAVNVLRTSGKVEPDSPRFSDLADLVLDAAMLEQQLSAVPPPIPKESSPLTQSTGPTTPQKDRTTPEKEEKPEKPSRHEKKRTLERVLGPAAPPPTVPLPQTPATPVRQDSLAHYRQSRVEQELPEPANGERPSEDVATEMGIHFTKSWNPSFTLPSPGSSSLPYLAATPPDSPTSRKNNGTPGRSSLSAGTPVRMRTISHSPAPSPQHATPTRLRTISHHNLSRALTPKEDIPPTPPPKSPRKYFSLKRKPTMPGTYPRNSASSEDSSVYISAPPSPPPPVPPHDRESIYGGGSSDASSIMSSSRSMKSKLKESSLSRAGSVMDRLWRRGKNKHDNATVAVVDADANLSAGHLQTRAPSPSHLSPFTLPASAHNASAPSTLQQRPTSWVSIATTGSNGEPFDSDIFDAFPSVPDEVPPLLSEQTGQSQSLNALNQRRPVSSAHANPPPNFLATNTSEMGYAPRGHTKQRSSIV